MTIKELNSGDKFTIVKEKSEETVYVYVIKFENKHFYRLNRHRFFLQSENDDLKVKKI